MARRIGRLPKYPRARMEKDAIRYAEEIYNMVFEHLDQFDDFSGEDAGKVAQAAAEAAERKIMAVLEKL